MRRTMTGIAVASLTVLAVGCGSSGGPKDASKEDFCDSYASLIDHVDISKGGEMTGKDIKEWAKELEKTGTPEGISDDQREGYEIFIDKAGDVDDDATSENLQDSVKVSDDDKKKVDDFSSYAEKECGDAMKKKVEEKMGSSMPSELSSEAPSDLPTEIPSDLESKLSELPTEMPSS